MEPLLHSSELLYGAGGVLLTALFGYAWRVCLVTKRQRLAEDTFWRELSDRVERERNGWAS